MAVAEHTHMCLIQLRTLIQEENHMVETAHTEKIQQRSHHQVRVVVVPVGIAHGIILHQLPVQPALCLLDSTGRRRRWTISS